MCDKNCPVMKFLTDLDSEEYPGEISSVISTIETNANTCETCPYKNLKLPQHCNRETCIMGSYLLMSTAEEVAYYVFSICFVLPENELNELLLKMNT